MDLVIGGSGFLGTHLVRALVADGGAVRVLARSRRPADPALAAIEWQEGDFGDAGALGRALDGVATVYHLATGSTPASSNADPHFDIESNLVKSLRLMQQMIERGIRRVVYVSSGGTVYGNPSVTPTPESSPLNPLCSYAVNKIAIEHYLGMYAAAGQLSPVVLRASNPYGPGGGRTGVQGLIPIVMRRIAAGAAIDVWGDGSLVRDYVHVDDVVRALRMAAVSGLTGAYNIGSAEGRSINEVIAVAGAVSGRTPQVRYLPGRPFDVREIVLDTARAQRDLGWQPRVSLQDGMRRLWEWQQGQEV